LHNSPAGEKFGKTPEALPVTETIHEQIVRLPIWIGLNDQERIISETYNFFEMSL
jgi:dTDP-4-amino-4,6-dideoxygalactose transaminase